MGQDRRQRRRRAAAIGGAAVAAKKHRDAKQAQQQAGAEDVPPAAAAPASEAGGLSEDKMTRLRDLGELHEQKVLTDEEFEREKAKDSRADGGEGRARYADSARFRAPCRASNSRKNGATLRTNEIGLRRCLTLSTIRMTGVISA